MERLEVDSEALPRQVAGTVTAAASYWCVCVGNLGSSIVFPCSFGQLLLFKGYLYFF